jgi:beta-glucosidase
LSVVVPVTNTGTRRGAEVVQCYVAPVAPRLVRPPKELKAFAKVWLDPGESTTVSLDLDERAFAFWDPGDPEWAELQERLARAMPLPVGRDASRGQRGWRVDDGRYDLHIGRSSADIAHVVPVTIGP